MRQVPMPKLGDNNRKGTKRPGLTVALAVLVAMVLAMWLQAERHDDALAVAGEQKVLAERSAAQAEQRAAVAEQETMQAEQKVEELSREVTVLRRVLRHLQDQFDAAHLAASGTR